MGEVLDQVCQHFVAVVVAVVFVVVLFSFVSVSSAIYTAVGIDGQLVKQKDEEEDDDDDEDAAEDEVEEEEGRNERDDDDDVDEQNLAVEDMEGDDT